MDKNLKIVSIIQARLGSTRLPGKVLADLSGKSMLERVIERVGAANNLDEVIVATSIENSDDELVQFIQDQNLCKIFRGSEEDVLSRYYECAKWAEADLIVRITADDPLKDPGIINIAVNTLIANPDFDYCSNTIEPTFPEGLDVEAFRFSALEQAYEEANLNSEREHVTPFIWKNPSLFNLHNFKYYKDLNKWRWTVDEPEDLQFMRIIFDKYKNNSLISYEEVINWLEENPEIVSINSSIKRNSGYLKAVDLELSTKQENEKEK